jgi:hypothetical protein
VSYSIPPINWTDPLDAMRRTVNSVRGLMDGKSNNTGTVTLSAGAATTTVTDARVAATSHITLTPLTANAAAMSVHISSRSGTPDTAAHQQFVVTHSNTANADQNFSYSITG